jgi:hypothetical protein
MLKMTGQNTPRGQIYPCHFYRKTGSGSAKPNLTCFFISRTTQSELHGVKKKSMKVKKASVILKSYTAIK